MTFLHTRLVSVDALSKGALRIMGVVLPRDLAGEQGNGRQDSNGYAEVNGGFHKMIVLPLNGNG